MNSSLSFHLGCHGDLQPPWRHGLLMITPDPGCRAFFPGTKGKKRIGYSLLHNFQIHKVLGISGTPQKLSWCMRKSALVHTPVNDSRMGIRQENSLNLHILKTQKGRREGQNLY